MQRIGAGTRYRPGPATPRPDVRPNREETKPTMPRPEPTGRLTADDYFAIIPDRLIRDLEVSDRAVRLYAILRRCADHATLVAMPTRGYLADTLGCSRDSIDRATRELVTAGWLTKTSRRLDDGTNDTNEYRLHTAPVRHHGRTNAATPPRTGAANRGRTGAAQINSHLDQQPGTNMATAAPLPIDVGDPLPAVVPRETSPAQQERDRWFAAVAVFAGPPEPHEFALYQRLITRAKADTDDPAEIVRRAARMRIEWGAKALTVPSLTKWWKRYADDGIGSALDDDAARLDAEIAVMTADILNAQHGDDLVDEDVIDIELEVELDALDMID